MLLGMVIKNIFNILLFFNGKYPKEVTGIEDTKKEMVEKEILGNDNRR